MKDWVKINFVKDLKAAKDEAENIRSLVARNNRDLNLCSIYDKRPDICRHEWVYENIFKGSMSIEDYEQMLNELCSKYIKLKEAREQQA